MYSILSRAEFNLLEADGVGGCDSGTKMIAKTKRLLLDQANNQGRGIYNLFNSPPF
jgi:hypothetical protein